MKRLSILIPAYNERETIREILERIEAVPMPVEKEVIIVDDGSTDGTRDILRAYDGKHVVVLHEKNAGKGAAIRTALAHATGDYVVPQDADLEYDPADLVPMVEKMIAEDLVALYGSREAGANRNRPSGPQYYLGGLLLTWITNALYRQKLTDEPTCYKMFKTEFLKGLPLVCERFEFCPEVTALTAKQGIMIPEIPVSYKPRSVEAGKKIRWEDGIEAIWTLIRYRF